MTETTIERTFHLRGPFLDLFTSTDTEGLMAGPAGCVAGETELWDPIAGKGIRFDELHARGIRPWVQTLAGPVLAEVPFVKGIADLYRVTLTDGTTTVVTADHRILTASGWMAASLLKPGSFVLSGSHSSVPHSSQTGEGSQGGCRPECHCGDPLLPSGSVADLAFVPSQSDAHGLAHVGWLRDVPASTTERTHPYPTSDHHAMKGSKPLPYYETSGDRPNSHATQDAQFFVLSGSRVLDGGSFRLASQSRLVSLPLSPLQPQGHDCESKQSRVSCDGSGQQRGVSDACGCTSPSTRETRQPLPQSLSPCRTAGTSSRFGHAGNECQHVFSCSHSRSQWVPVETISFERRDIYYDLHVPGEEHYLADGIWSHNTGKTTAALIYAHMMSLENPNLRTLVVRKTMESLTKSTLITYQEHVANDTITTGDVTFFGGNLKEPPGFRYSNGSRITLGGLDNPERVKSAEYDLIIVDEATELTLKDWQTLTSRLRGHVLKHPRIIGACNPEAPGHWIKKRCDSGATRLFETRHEHNPSYYDDAGEMTEEGARYIKILDGLTGLEYRRLRLGQWVAAEGIIYSDFDAAKHIIPPREIPEEWPRYWAVDFGHDHPFVCQWWAEDPDGRLFLYREWYMSNMIVEDHARKMLELSTREGDPEKGEPERVWTEPKPYAIVCDHDAEGRKTLERYLGIGTTPARKSVLEGIQAVANRFKNDRLFIVEGYQVTRDQRLVDKGKPTCLTEELPGYVWDTSSGSNAKERPVKESDDGADCARYLIMYRESRFLPRVRFMQ